MEHYTIMITPTKRHDHSCIIYDYCFLAQQSKYSFKLQTIFICISS